MTTKHNRGWFTPPNPFNLKLPESVTAVRREMVLMMTELPAGQPASGSDGSWIHATGMTDMSGFASNGDDGLYNPDPWRQQAQGQQMPDLAGQPAVFHPQSGASTPFGTPGSQNSGPAASQNSLHDRIQAMRMDPQYQLLAANPPTLAGHPAAGHPASRPQSEH